MKAFVIYDHETLNWINATYGDDDPQADKAMWPLMFHRMGVTECARQDLKLHTIYTSWISHEEGKTRLCAVKEPFDEKKHKIEDVNFIFDFELTVENHKLVFLLAENAREYYKIRVVALRNFIDNEMTK